MIDQSSVKQNQLKALWKFEKYLKLELGCIWPSLKACT